jgi:hypothetical protein
MQVTVDLAGFHRWGVTVRRTTPASGTIVALGSAGITVRLDTVLEGLDTVTVDADRVTAAQ